MPGIVERRRSEELDAPVVSRMGKESALYENNGLVSKPLERRGNGGDLAFPRTQAVASVAAPDEQRSKQDGAARDDLGGTDLCDELARHGERAPGGGNGQPYNENGGVGGPDRSDLVVGGRTVQHDDRRD